MHTPQPESPAYREVLARAVEAGHLRGVGGAVASMQLMGAGESYAAWRVEAVSGVVLIRVARRDPSDMPRPIAQEFVALGLVPVDLGSSGISYDDSVDNALGRAYVVTTCVPGEVRPAHAWTTEHLRVHARRLALLHHTNGRTDAIPEPVSHEARDALQWWKENRPDVVEHPRVQRLLEPWLVYLATHDDVWRGARQERLIHSDLVVTNIVIGPDDVPRYVDWEWGEPGDAAKDLAMIGGRITGGPWYVPLSSPGIRHLVHEYATARGELGTSVDAEQLALQRNAWEVAERLLGCLHFLTRVPHSVVHRAATEEILTGLEGVLLNGAGPSTPG